MKISHNWLREYVAHQWEWPELVERLTMAGLELEGIDDIASRLKGVLVAEVTACERHPDAAPQLPMLRRGGARGAPAQHRNQ